MDKATTKPPKLPPRTARQCWSTFLQWVLGVPLVIVGGLTIIGAALWLAGGQDLMWQTMQAMGTALLYILGILLIYPLLMVMWVAELRAGLQAARDWEALSPEAQKAAMAEAKELQADRRATRKAKQARQAKD